MNFYCKILFCLLPLVAFAAMARDRMDLKGEWLFQLSNSPTEIPGEGTIFLPNTLDNTRKSIYNPPSNTTSQLRREFSFEGTAVFSREVLIPQDWEGKIIKLTLERTKPSIIIINGDTTGYSSRVSSPQIFDLTDYLSPGTHLIQISVNNKDSIPPLVAHTSHAFSEATQTNWNGILGKIFLEASEPFHIAKISLNENDLEGNSLFTINFSEESQAVHHLSLQMNDKMVAYEKIVPGTISVQLPISPDRNMLWSAATPRLHDITLVLKDSLDNTIDSLALKTGFRSLSTSGRHLIINDRPEFLRGTVNAAVFPLTAHPPMDLESWLDYFSIIKEYGLNHVRFHSWSPPDAAFEAADNMGVYLMVELPIWGEFDRDLKFQNNFLKEDLEGIMMAYSLHPSFVMFSNGNELFGDTSLMSEFMHEARHLNPRVLTTAGSNVYLGIYGDISDEDFIVGSKTGNDLASSVRGSDSFSDSLCGGYLNSHYPNTLFNFEEATKDITVPLISHEVGQYQSYPDFSEIEEYTGILKPDNLIEFQRRAKESGKLKKATDYNLASGKWASKLYKTEAEAALRTPGITGIQIFGLQDYPGQGTANVGILNTFMKSKDFISPQEWRKSFSDFTILAEFPKFTFEGGEIVEVGIKTANFTTRDDSIVSLLWKTDFKEGSIEIKSGFGVIDQGIILLNLPEVKQPGKFTLDLSSSDNIFTNSYDFWIYPKNHKDLKNVFTTDKTDEAIKWLEEGKKVLLMPDTSTIAATSLPSLFVTDFWNYGLYKQVCKELNLPPSPGTLGLLIDNHHPALKGFPTASHTDWQWYSIINNSRPLIIDRLPSDYEAIIEVIDNPERNYPLALLMEFNVAKGKLMILPANKEELEKTPEGRQLLYSLKEYIGSKSFKPKYTLTPDQLLKLLTVPSTNRKIKELQEN